MTLFLGKSVQVYKKQTRTKKDTRFGVSFN